LFDSFREAVEVQLAESVALRAAKQAKVIWLKKLHKYPNR
jgi:hypothetical protein